MSANVGYVPAGVHTQCCEIEMSPIVANSGSAWAAGSLIVRRFVLGERLGELVEVLLEHLGNLRQRLLLGLLCQLGRRRPQRLAQLTEVTHGPDFRRKTVRVAPAGAPVRRGRGQLPVLPAAGWVHRWAAAGVGRARSVWGRWRWVERSLEIRCGC